MSAQLGGTFDPKRDGARLVGQRERVFTLMSDGLWRTLREISVALYRLYLTHDTEGGIGARLRDWEKREFGGGKKERRRREGADGLWEYRFVIGEKSGPKNKPFRFTEGDIKNVLPILRRLRGFAEPSEQPLLDKLIFWFDKER